MSQKKTIIRQGLIVDCLDRKPSSFEEIRDYLSFQSELQGMDLDISVRTFQRDIIAIADLFQVEIEYNTKTKVYEITYRGPLQMNKRFTEAFDVLKVMQAGDSLQGKVFFEPRKASGTEHLHGILHAIQNQFFIRFHHQKYWNEERTIREVIPLAIREFKNRWYLVGREEKDEIIRTYGMDRISHLEISKRQFKSLSFDVENYFRHCFGIIRPDDPKAIVEEVILQVEVIKGRYFKSLPLHPSQKILEEGKEYITLSISTYLTRDLVHELLSHGSEVKVLAPTRLQELVGGELKKGAGQYLNL